MQYPEKKITLRDGRICTIRSATADDAEELLELLNLVSRQSSYLLYDASEAATISLKRERTFLERYEKAEHSLMLLAIIDGWIVGSCSFTVPGSARMVRHRRELSVMVQEEYRSFGIGRELILTSLEAARESGAAWMELEVFAENTQAVALYESLGFTQYGYRREGIKRQNGQTGDELLMNMKL